MTKFLVTVYSAGSENSYEEEVDITAEELEKRIYADLISELSVTVEEIEPESEPEIITELSDEQIQDMAYNIAANSSGSMSGLHYPAEYDNLSKELQEITTNTVYSYMSDCEDCGWSFETGELSMANHGELLCWSCEGHREDEEE